MRDNRENARKPEISVVVNEDGALACLYGCIDIDSSPAVRERLLLLLQSPNCKIVKIDLSAVTHIDSSGVATLIEALKIAREHRTQVRLQGLQDRLLRLFEFTGILSLFNGEHPNLIQSGCEAV